MKSNFDQLVNELGAYTNERDAELAEHGSFAKAYGDYVAGQKSCNLKIRKAMSTLTQLQKSATAIRARQNRSLIEQVPQIMAKARVAFHEGQISGSELCLIEIKKNRLCDVMAARGLIR